MLELLEGGLSEAVSILWKIFYNRNSAVGHGCRAGVKIAVVIHIPAVPKRFAVLGLKDDGIASRLLRLFDDFVLGIEIGKHRHDGAIVQISLENVAENAEPLRR